MPRAVVISAVRTPIGRYGGALSGVRPDDLAAHAIAAAVERSGVDPAEIEDVYLGCANQAGEDNRNVARMAALLAGLPQSVPGMTINRLCASGLTAVVDACRAIAAGEGDLFVAGGVESMSRAPLVLAKGAKPFARGNHVAYDTALAWLGMGGDGHVASLFPSADPTADDPQRVRLLTPVPLPPEAPFDRVTLTIPALLDADELLFVLRGADKRALFEAAAMRENDLPIARLLAAAHQPVTCFT
jgi:hypothetical protein